MQGAIILAASALIGYMGMRFGLSGGFAPAYETGDFRAFLPQEGSGVEVAVYGTSTCPACAATRAYLMRSRVAFNDFDVQMSPDARKRFVSLGGSQVPVIIVRNRKFVGFRESVLQSTLSEFRLMHRLGDDAQAK